MTVFAASSRLSRGMLTGRAGSAPARGDEHDVPQTTDIGAEAAAAAATTAIAGLRSRLSHQSTLEHPAVCRELRLLEEQLAAQLERNQRPPGRHRSPASLTPCPHPG